MGDRETLRGESVSGIDTRPTAIPIEMFRHQRALEMRKGTLLEGGPLIDPSDDILLPSVKDQQATIGAQPLDPSSQFSSQRILESIGEALFPISENVPARPTVKIPGTSRSLDLFGALDAASNVADMGAPAAAKTAATKAGIPLAAMIAKGGPDLRRVRGPIGRAQFEASTPFRHGTSFEKAREIEDSGFSLDVSAIPADLRNYDYAQLGHGTTYGAREGSWWFSEPGAGRAAKYDTEVPFQFAPEARIRVLRTQEDADALARDAGYESWKRLHRELDVHDTFNEVAKIRSESARKRITKVADAIDIKKEIGGGPSWKREILNTVMNRQEKTGKYTDIPRWLFSKEQGVSSQVGVLNPSVIRTHKQVNEAAMDMAK